MYELFFPVQYSALCIAISVEIKRSFVSDHKTQKIKCDIVRRKKNSKNNVSFILKAKLGVCGLVNPTCVQQNRAVTYTYRYISKFHSLEIL